MTSLTLAAFKIDRSNQSPELSQVMSFLIWQVIRLSRLFVKSCEVHFFSESVLLFRTALESAVRMSILTSNSAVLDSLIALSGLQDGSWAYKRRSDGRPDLRNAIENKTGRCVSVHISNEKILLESDMVELRDEFHNFYFLLSNYIHPNIRPDNDPIPESVLLERGCLISAAALIFFIYGTYLSGGLTEAGNENIKNSILYLCREFEDVSRQLELDGSEFGVDLNDWIVFVNKIKSFIKPM